MTSEMESLLRRYPDRVPVIVRAAAANMPQLEKTKYLVPKDFNFGAFSALIRSKLGFSASKAVFFFTPKNILPRANQNMEELFAAHGSDGVLRLTYNLENTFGGGGKRKPVSTARAEWDTWPKRDVKHVQHVLQWSLMQQPSTDASAVVIKM